MIKKIKYNVKKYQAINRKKRNKKNKKSRKIGLHILKKRKKKVQK